MKNIHLKTRSLGTHNGSFHADEVTACALMMIFDLIDRDQIIRTRDFKALDECEYVCDVGGVYNIESKRFDHHQSEYKGFLSSAGMVWKYLYDIQKVDQKLYQYLNDMLIIGVDAVDNGKATVRIGHCSFSFVIANFVPVSHDIADLDMDLAFFRALDFCLGHLERLFERYAYIQQCSIKVEKVMQLNGKLLEFSESIPWVDAFFDLGGEDHPAEFVIMPAGQHWKLRGVPPSNNKRMKVRVPMPKKWAGLMGEELKKCSGIQGAIFCHKGLFISIWKTKGDAMNALQITLKDRS